MKFNHWNYFIALEKDVINLSRYIEYDNSNLKTFSLEIARIVMSSTQEVDVLLKQICQKHGNDSETEEGYRLFIPVKYPKITTIEVEIEGSDLKFKPFESWATKITPSWWTANNKVKHARHTNFKDASL